MCHVALLLAGLLDALFGEVSISAPSGFGRGGWGRVRTWAPVF
jgi:hypothetical protein